MQAALDPQRVSDSAALIPIAPAGVEGSGCSLNRSAYPLLRPLALGYLILVVAVALLLRIPFGRRARAKRKP